MNMLTAATRGQRIDYIYDAHGDAEVRSFALTKTPRINIEGFVSGASRYFATRAKQEAIIGSPYVAYEGAFHGANDVKVAPLEFTATMRVTGRLRGTAYLTASRSMLTILLMRMGATDITTETMRGALHELAQAMAASARHVDPDLLVWDPSVANERNGVIECGRDQSPLVVPIHWRKFTAQLVICMER
jgi:chemotaxis protein CheX